MIPHTRPLLLALSLLLLGCGPTEDAAAADAAGADSAVEATTNDAQASPDAQDSGPPGDCDPMGTWLVTYPVTQTVCLNSLHDDIIVSPGDAGGVTVVWSDRGNTDCPDSWNLTYDTGASISADGCTLKTYAHSHHCYVSMGEEITDFRDLVLQVSGSSATGTLHYASNCNGTSTVTADVPASAQRQ